VFDQLLNTSMLCMLNRMLRRYQWVRHRDDNKRHRRCWWQCQLLVLAWVHVCVGELNQNMSDYACFEWTSPDMRTHMHVDNSSDMSTMSRRMGRLCNLSGYNIATTRGWLSGAVVTWPQFVCCLDKRNLLRIRMQGNSFWFIILVWRLDSKIHMFQR